MSGATTVEAEALFPPALVFLSCDALGADLHGFRVLYLELLQNWDRQVSVKCAVFLFLLLSACWVVNHLFAHGTCEPNGSGREHIHIFNK